MFFKVLPLIFTMASASPIYQTGLEQTIPGLSLHSLSQASGLLSQPLASLYGNLDQLSTLSKSLLSSHIGTEKLQGLSIPLLSAGLGIGSQIHHELPFTLPLKKELEMPEKSIAGALIKQVPKVSKLPISVAYSPKTLELAALAQAGLLQGGLTGKSLLSSLGIPFGF